MALDRTKQYDVLNYCPSAVSISTRDFNELVPGGTSEDPARLPLKLDDIMFINTKTRVFKDGFLFFEPEIEEEIYEELRIKDWKSILKDEDIEDIVLNPTVAGLQKVLDVTSVMLFERIYGVYVGLKNAGASITLNVQTIMDRRHSEISNGKLKTEIKLQPIEQKPTEDIEQMRAQMERQAAELEKMKAMIAQMNAASASAETSVEDTKPKPRARSGTKKSAVKADETTEA